MHSFRATKSVFNFNGDLSGSVLVTMLTRSGEGTIQYALPGDDLREFIRYLQREYPGALSQGAEHPLDVLADKVSDLTARVDKMQALLDLYAAVHESNRGENHCPNAGCLLDAGHASECRKLEGAP